jgi:putative ABC transport system substrate-binding protein
MKRRDFVTLLSGTAAIISADTVLGQEADRVPHVGMLMGGLESDPETKPRLEAFQKGLRELGLRDGRNIHIDYRWGGANPNQTARNARELIALNPEVIVATTTPAVAALLRETRTIPIVFVQVVDPVGQGFVGSLARPGGNITGFTTLEFSLGGKWLEILKEIAPQVVRVAIVFNPDTIPYPAYVRSIEAAASSFSVQPVPTPVRGPAEMEVAIKAFAHEPNGAMVVLPDIYMAAHRQRVIALAAEYHLPAVYGFRFFATDGGLVSYGTDSVDPYRRAATYVDRILKGANPGELPVQAPTKFELTINLKTAKALGLAIPLSILARADEVIE